MESKKIKSKTEGCPVAPRCSFKVSDDLKTGILTYTLPGRPPVVIQMDAKAIDVMLTSLGNMRRRMKPSVPKALPRGMKAEFIPDPELSTDLEPLSGNPIVHVGDPRYGWLHYMVSRGRAKQLAAALEKQAARPQLLSAERGKLH